MTPKRNVEKSNNITKKVPATYVDWEIDKILQAKD